MNHFLDTPFCFYATRKIYITTPTSIFTAFIIDTYIQLKAELDAKKEAEKSNEPVKEEKSWVRN